MTSFLERQPPIAEAGDQSEASLRDYLGIFLESWPWLLAFAVAGLALGLYVGYSQAPRYAADALMRIEQNSGSGGAGQQAQQLMLNQQFGAPSTVSAETAVLRSRSILGAAVDRLNLRIDAEPDYWGGIGRAVAYWRSADTPRPAPFGLLSAHAWGGESIDVSGIRLPKDTQQASFKLIAAGGGRYRLRDETGEALLEGQVGKPATGDWPGHGAVQILVEELRARPGTRFNVHYRRREAVVASLKHRLTVQEAERGSGILALGLTAGSPAAAEHQLDAIMQVYLEKNVERQSEEASRRLAFLKKQLPDLKQQRDQAETRLREFQEKAGLLSLDTASQSLLDRLSSLDSELAEQRFNRKELLQQYTDEHPAVRAVDSKIASLRQERSQLLDKVKQLPQQESEFLNRQREVKVANELYQQLLNRAQELEISRAGITGFVHIIDKAYSPASRVAPQRGRIALLAALIGLVLGAAFIVLRTVFRSTLRTPEDIESRFGLPLYATVPFSQQEKKLAAGKGEAQPLTLCHPHDLAIESLRSLRTSLQFALLEGAGNCVAFTSPTPECGKSFVSLNMAILLAQGGKRVVLVDADLRRGRLRQALNMPKAPGLSEYLAGEAGLEEILLPTPQGDLQFIGTGHLPPNPSELLMTPALPRLLKSLEDKADYVLLDLPPAMNVADAGIVARQAAASFLVTRSEHTTPHDLRDCIRRLRHDRVNIKGIVFNGFKPSRLRYGAARYAYYSQQYGRQASGFGLQGRFFKRFRS